MTALHGSKRAVLRLYRSAEAFDSMTPSCSCNSLFESSCPYMLILYILQIEAEASLKLHLKFWLLQKRSQQS